MSGSGHFARADLGGGKLGTRIYSLEGSRVGFAVAPPRGKTVQNREKISFALQICERPASSAFWAPCKAGSIILFFTIYHKHFKKLSYNFLRTGYVCVGLGCG